MNSLHNDEDDEKRHNERELTLNTGTILGIFMALVLLCGAFFGFGYKVGSHHAVQSEHGLATDTPTEPSSNFTDFKPAAGSPENVSEPSATVSRPAAQLRNEERSAEVSGKPLDPAVTTRTARGRADTPGHTASDRPDVSATVASTPPSGTYFVQVAAVSHEEDAQLLIHALKEKGYPVGAHTQPQDKFYHVQVGPFDSHKDADAAKQRLLADGYQPIIK